MNPGCRGQILAIKSTQFLSIFMTVNSDAGTGGGAIFGRLVNPILTGGGQIMHTNYHCPPFRGITDDHYIMFPKVCANSMH